MCVISFISAFAEFLTRFFELPSIFLFVFPDSSISFSFFLLALMLLQIFLTISLALLSPSRSLIFNSYAWPIFSLSFTSLYPFFANFILPFSLFTITLST